MVGSMSREWLASGKSENEKFQVPLFSSSPSFISRDSLHTIEHRLLAQLQHHLSRFLALQAAAAVAPVSPLAFLPAHCRPIHVHTFIHLFLDSATWEGERQVVRSAKPSYS